MDPRRSSFYCQPVDLVPCHMNVIVLPWNATSAPASPDSTVLSASVDPVACPACRVLQRLFLTREVVERIELVTAVGLRAISAFEQQVGGKTTVRHPMRGWLNGIAVVLMNLLVLHFNFIDIRMRACCEKRAKMR